MVSGEEERREEEDVARLLERVGADSLGTSELLAATYAELRSMADALMRGERGSHTLQPTALVHEAFLKLVDARAVGDAGRLAFLQAASVAMRRVLVDHARTRGREKRGGAWRRVTLQGLQGDGEGHEEDVDLLQLDEALDALKELDPRQARIVELRFFSGMTGQEIADALGVSRNTVVRELTVARAWLARELARGV